MSIADLICYTVALMIRAIPRCFSRGLPRKHQRKNGVVVGSVLPRRSSPSTGGRRGIGPLILRGAVGTARWPQCRDALSANPLVDRGAAALAHPCAPRHLCSCTSQAPRSSRREWGERFFGCFIVATRKHL